MTKIKLLHSYLYIENTKNLKIKNNKIYDSNNNFICGLSNLPSNNNGIKIILEKNLIKNKQSKKIFNTYYEKNNVKLYLEFDINKNVIYNSNFLLKLIKNNYLNFLNIKDNLFNCLCINKNCEKKPFKNYNIVLQDQNIIQIFSLCFDLSNNIIKNVNINNNKTFNLNFNILYSDYLLGTIKILNNYNLVNKTLVICNNKSIKSLWEENLKGSNILVLEAYEISMYDLRKYNFIIFSDIRDSEFKNIIQKYFKYSKSFLFIYTNCEEETIMKFIKKFYSAINIRESVKEIYNITAQTLYNYSKCIIYHKFYDNLLPFKNVKRYIFKDTCKINPLIKYIRFDITKSNNKNNTKTKCAICLDKVCENDFVYLNCGHKFCKNCISKLEEHNLNCSICRSKISYYKKVVNENDLLNSNNWYYVGNVLKNVINEIKKSDYESIILLENLELYNLLNSLLVYYAPKKFNILCDYSNILSKINKENKIINFFYLKNNNKLKKRCNYLCLFLKNFYSIINYFEFQVIDY